ncbi:MAG: ATP-dependent Clp protease ATP-binding subunit [Acidaminococcaceae bacterium]|nr:ATP-dependent Clp protease ATP-binding subunit [Acidaminococcaceae bacterium]
MAGQKGENARNILEEFFKPLRRLAEKNYHAEQNQKDHFYTDLAEKILVGARRTAVQRQQEEIGTEHILWAMLQEPESQAAHLLLRCGVDKYTLLGELETWMGKTVEGANPASYTKEASAALHYAKSFSDTDGLYLISSGHILLGLLAEEGCVASRVLARFTIDMNRVQVMMHEEFIQTHALPEKNKFKSQAKKEKAEAELQKALKLLNGFGRNLNELASQDKLDPMLGREKELEHVMRILCRRTKNNPVLIGESGVGKTAIAEGLAQRIANGEVPEFLSDKIIFSLELGYVVAGAKYRGELEERLRNIIEAVKHCPRIILFMDELQMLMNGGDGTMNIANIIKPALARGELHVIGATTLEDYRKSVEKDAALERRFQPVRVDAPDTEAALKILKRLSGRYERYHHVQVTEEALEAAVKLSDRYLTDRNLPDKAIDILDEACASVRLHSSKDYSGQMGDPVVDADTVRHIISQWTNIPLTRLNAAESSSLLQLENALHERIVGQNAAVKGVAQAVRRARAGLKDPRRPVGSFLFLGPTGVGKTELAKALADNLFGDERALLRFDMSEYMEKHTASRLIGAPPGYVGYEEGGRLTSAVKRRPYSIILLDEIEKAHPDIFNLLLQIMEDGRLTDGQGVTVDFRNCVILMTSNACAEMMSDRRSLGFAADADTAVANQKQNILQGIKDIFRPEFLNRLDEIIVFDPLGKKELAQIVDKMLEELQKRLQDTGMSLRMTAAARDKLLQTGMDVRYGARPLRRALQKEIEDKLADLYLEGTFSAGDHILIDVLSGDFSFSRLKEAETENMVPVQEEQNYG